MMLFVLMVSQCFSVQAPPSPLGFVGFAWRSFGDSAAVLVRFDEESLAQLVLVQHSVGLLHDGARCQLFTGQNPSVFCIETHTH